MKGLREFDIEIFKLSNKKHNYSFELNDAFFSNFEDSLVNNGKLTVDVIVDKSDVLIVADFSIKGNITLICDRSLEEFEYPIETVNKIIFKYGEEYAELTDEIISIPQGTQRLNFAQYIYEFIGLTIPMKKLHPKFVTTDEILSNVENDEETLLIYSTESSKDEDDKDEDENIDPRWKILNGLKHNNN